MSFFRGKISLWQIYRYRRGRRSRAAQLTAPQPPPPSPSPLEFPSGSSGANPHLPPASHSHLQDDVQGRCCAPSPAGPTGPWGASGSLYMCSEVGTCPLSDQEDPRRKNSFFFPPQGHLHRWEGCSREQRNHLCYFPAHHSTPCPELLCASPPWGCGVCVLGRGRQREREPLQRSAPGRGEGRTGEERECGPVGTCRSHQN